MGKLEFLLDKPISKKLTKEEILAAIPHREPFLFIDETYIIEEDKYIIGTRTFTGQEDFFKGHFPSHPVVPGVLTLEIMAQAAAAAIMQSPRFKGKIGFFLSVDFAKFRKQINPGDSVRIPIQVLRVGKITKVYAEAYTDNGLCVEAELNFVLGDKQ